MKKSEFYSVNYSKDDHNEITGVHFKDPIRIDIIKFFDFLYDNGFRRYDYEDDNFFIQITDDKIVKRVTITKMQDFVWRYIDNLPEFIDELELCERSHLKSKLVKGIGYYFHKQRLNVLTPKEPIIFNEDKHDTKYIYYLNGFVKITKKGMQLREYKKLKHYIWESEILQRNFERNPSKPDNIAKDFFEVISGKTDSLGDLRKLPQRHKALEICAGYLLHNFYATKLKAIIFTDSTISDENEANGRSGKTLFCRFIGNILSSDLTDPTLKTYCEINGKDFDTKDKHKYSRADLDTKLIVINDLRRNFDLESLYNDVTEGVTVDKKGLQPFRIVAKMVLPTNKIPKNQGESSKDRFMEFEFSDYFNSRRTPEMVYKHWFFRDWNEQHWSEYDNYMCECVQAYFENDAKLLEPDGINLSSRKLRSETHTDFIDYMTDLNLQFNERYDKKILFNNFLDQYEDWKENKLRQAKFTKWIKSYCKYTDGYMPFDKNDPDRYSHEVRDSSTRYIIFRQKE